MALTKKQENEMRKGYAFRLYMSGESQKAIAKTVGCTEATVSKWVNSESWEQQKRDQNTSTVALANALMAAAKKMSEQIVKLMETDEPDVDKLTKCSDNLVKIMASAERISKTVTRATVIDVIIALDRWLMRQVDIDPNLTSEKLKFITDYHQKYIAYITESEML